MDISISATISMIWNALKSYQKPPAPDYPSLITVVITLAPMATVIEILLAVDRVFTVLLFDSDGISP